jgi:putative DNA primase/helicase
VVERAMRSRRPKRPTGPKPRLPTGTLLPLLPLPPHLSATAHPEPAAVQEPTTEPREDEPVVAPGNFDIHDVVALHTARHVRDGVGRVIGEQQRRDRVENLYPAPRNIKSDYQMITRLLKPGKRYAHLLGVVYAVAGRKSESAEVEALPPVEPTLSIPAARPTATVVAFPPPVIGPPRPHHAPPEEEEPEAPLQIEGDVEPWAFPVNGAELLTAIRDAFLRFVVLPPGAAEVLAVFPIMTHALDLCEFRPQITLESPVKRTGKTRVLRILGPLCRRSLPASNISLAVLYHSTDANAPTLLMDEGESYIPQNRQMIGVLNSGLERTEAWTLRMDMTTKVRRKFRTFAPLVIAAIRKPRFEIPETIKDRGVTMRLQRKRANQHVERFRKRDVEPLRILARKAARWVADHPELEDADPVMPASWHDRLQDISRMAVTICDCAGGPWPELIRSSITSLLDMQIAAAEPGELLLADLAEYFHDPKHTERRRRHHRFRSTDIVEHLIQNERWGDMNTSKLALMLEPFGIKPEPMRIDGKSTRGYERGWFDDTLAAYVPEGATPATFATVAPVAPVAGSDDDEPLDDDAMARVYAAATGRRKTRSAEEITEARRERAEKRRYWGAPVEMMTDLIAELGGRYFDCCPHPRPEWDGLKVEWNRKATTWVWCHPPFTGGGPDAGVAAWIKKALRERDKGCLIVLCLPDYQSRAKDTLIRAGAEIRQIGSPAFLDLEDGTPNPNPSTPCFIAILRPPKEGGSSGSGC